MKELSKAQRMEISTWIGSVFVHETYLSFELARTDPSQKLFSEQREIKEPELYRQQYNILQWMSENQIPLSVLKAATPDFNSTNFFKPVGRHTIWFDLLTEEYITHLGRCTSEANAITIIKRDIDARKKRIQDLSFLEAAKDDQPKGNSALHLAVLGLDHERITQLLRDTPKPQLSEWLTATPYGNTPLVLALKLHAIDIAKAILNEMIDLGLNLNQPSQYRMSALHWACFLRQEEIAKQLAKSGADIHAKNANGFKPEELIKENYKSLTIKYWMGAKCIKQNDVDIEEAPFLVDLLFHFGRIALNLDFCSRDEFKVDSYSFTRTGDRFQFFFDEYHQRFLEYRNSLPTFNLDCIARHTETREFPAQSMMSCRSCC